MSVEADNTVRARILYSGEVVSVHQQADGALQPGSLAVVVTRFGDDLARVIGVCPACDEEVFPGRPAVAVDEEQDSASREMERSARSFALDCIDELQLAMNLVSVHRVLGGDRILFFFTADSRVDFRGLVRMLADRFHTRIELRQISSREETRMTGGLGVCGRELCCASLGCKLAPVSIRMAKSQGLSLSSSKLSGQCGRLLCCLAYENDFYRDAAASFPATGVQVELAGNNWEVIGLDYIRSTVTLRDSEGKRRCVDSDCFERVSAREWVVHVSTGMLSED